MNDDRFDLQRFVTAQEQDGSYDRALAELRSGRKQTHWIWYVFPQIAGLGRSSTAQLFALTDRDEAVAYLEHPVLGPRLREATQALADLDGSHAETVLGSTDAMKVRSSMTLFAAVAPHEPVFWTVLESWYDGEPDAETTRRL